MSRARKQKARDKNKARLPQTPDKDKLTSNDDLELAKEVADEYQYEQKPGFPVTGVDKK
ncbi:YfhD family protein [Bacillus sp. FJAT-45350]|uniref:YfhD family protein n=1 Tax=Bacillus sp. FJAT-45350 TaxID=2011014 RepID=UPI0015C7D4C0|nr:YfhD family protein [Bacillus sp. FJAT-45350]